MWQEFSAAVPAHLLSVGDRVKETVIASKSDGTIRTYLGGFKRWKRWASSNSMRHLPANPFQFAIYLQCLIENANSPSPIRNAVFSIDWAQQLAGLPKVSGHPLVTTMLSASQRILGKPKIKKEPISSEMLKSLVSSKMTDKCSLSDLRTISLCLICYAGFFSIQRTLSHTGL